MKFVFGNISYISLIIQVRKVCYVINSINWFLYIIYVHVDLKGFLQFVTGSTHATENITVNFDSDGSEAIAASTCGRQLTLSSKIVDQELFVSAIRALEKRFLTQCCKIS